MNILRRLLTSALLLFAGGLLLSLTAIGCNEPHQRYYYYRDYREPDYYYYESPRWGDRHEEHEWAEHHEHHEHEGHRR